ncbi:MAG: 1-(5-phosphoribosyl)-5-[(5-phosphoribosylamino)methylideneamino] imidazole-4-carboxamide isomerase [Chloroflexi bacterium]|nr:1-(5-phosphoribosyl)-5-[(5-phosphoribosylamino)methylideneamino] imidazole-4-carboxamide isomerase [Chloroflexota bacterium]
MIVFPAIDLRRGKCVRLRQGRPEAETVFSDDPVAMAERWASQGAEWLHIVNLDGAFGQASSPPLGPPQPWGGSSKNLRVVKEIISSKFKAQSSNFQLPTSNLQIQFGGGLRTLADIEEALKLGLTRVILGTVAVEEPSLVAEAVRRFGAERIVVGIDARREKVATHGWQEVSSLTATELALRVRGLGVERVVYTDIARDGMLSGVNVEAVRELAQRTGLKVIASGGVSSLDDLRRLKEVEASGVEGVIIGQALYSGAVGLREAIQISKSANQQISKCKGLPA